MFIKPNNHRCLEDERVLEWKKYNVCSRHEKYFNHEKSIYAVGSQERASHGSVSKRYENGYKYAIKLMYLGQIDINNSSGNITIIGHRQALKSMLESKEVKEFFIPSSSDNQEIK